MACGLCTRPGQRDKAAKSILATRTEPDDYSCRSLNPSNCGARELEFSFWFAGQRSKVFLAVVSSAIHLDPLIATGRPTFGILRTRVFSAILIIRPVGHESMQSKTKGFFTRLKGGLLCKFYRL